MSNQVSFFSIFQQHLSTFLALDEVILDYLSSMMEDEQGNVKSSTDLEDLMGELFESYGIEKDKISELCESIVKDLKQNNLLHLEEKNKDHEEELKEGEEVLVFSSENGTFRPAKIIRIIENTSKQSKYLVQFEDDNQEFEKYWDEILKVKKLEKPIQILEEEDEKEEENPSIPIRDQLNNISIQDERIQIEEHEKERKEEEDEDDEDVCEMCERPMPLTRHHLIPRTTHKFYLKKGYTQDYLNTCINICRPCHSGIHQIIDEKTMGREYQTLEKLMEHEGVQKLIKYMRTQRVRSKQDGVLRYRR